MTWTSAEWDAFHDITCPEPDEQVINIAVERCACGAPDVNTPHYRYDVDKAIPAHIPCRETLRPHHAWEWGCSNNTGFGMYHCARCGDQSSVDHMGPCEVESDG